MTTPRAAGWFDPRDCRLDDLRALVEQTTDLAGYRYASAVRQNVLVYGPGLAEQASSPEGRREVQAELARAMLDGPGIVLFERAFPDQAVVDRATDAFTAMIVEQKASGAAAGDPYDKPGE